MIFLRSLENEVEFIEINYFSFDIIQLYYNFVSRKVDGV